jgi:hypothetical protein
VFVRCPKFRPSWWGSVVILLSLQESSRILFRSCCNQTLTNLFHLTVCQSSVHRCCTYSMRRWRHYEIAQEAEIKDQSFSQSLTPSIQSVNLSTTLLPSFLFTSCPLRFSPSFPSFRTEMRVSMMLGLRGMGLPSRCSWILRSSELLCTLGLELNIDVLGQLTGLSSRVNQYTFWCNISVSSARVNEFWTAGPLQVEPRGCPERLVPSYRPTAHKVSVQLGFTDYYFHIMTCHTLLGQNVNYRLLSNKFICKRRYGMLIRNVSPYSYR